MKTLSCCAIGLLIAGSSATLQASEQTQSVEQKEAPVVGIPSVVLDGQTIQIPGEHVESHIIKVPRKGSHPVIVTIPQIHVNGRTMTIPRIHVDGRTMVIPQIHFDARAMTIPQIHMDAHVLQVPSIQYNIVADDDPRVEIVEQGSSTVRQERKETTAQSRQFLTGQAYQSFNGFSSPQLAKKTREVALLRQMLTLKLTSRDIERAIPLLKDLKGADSTVPAKPEQALDEEYNELLKAKPGDPVPESSWQAMRDGGQTIRSRKLAIWERMAQAIGLEKERGIRGMLRTENSTNWLLGSGVSSFFTPSTAAPRAVRPIVRRREGAAAPSSPDVPAAPATAEAPIVAKPVAGDDDNSPPAAQPATPAEDAAPVVVVPQEKPAKRGQRSAPATPRAEVFMVPGSGATLDSTGNRLRLFFSYSQVSIDELIDLFERKLAVMRH